MLSLCICTWNRKSIIEECVRAAVDSCMAAGGNQEVVIVDNGSTDGTWDIVLGLTTSGCVKAVREMRAGLSNARNLALKTATGDLVAFIDDDVVVSREYVRELCATLADTNADVVGGPLFPEWEALPPFWLDKGLYGILGLLEGEQTVEGRGYPRVFGANMAFKREVLKSFGDAPFDPQLGRTGNRLMGNEESFLIDSLWAQGAKVAFSEKALAYHRVPAKRLTLRYFLRWHFDGGISACREAYLRSGIRSLPRWVVGELIRRGLEVPWYLLTFRPRKSVRGLFRFAGRLGRTCEHVRTGFRRNQ